MMFRSKLAAVLGGSLLAAVVLGFGVPTAPADDGTPLDLAAYDRTWSEDFDSLDVTPWGESEEGSRWIAHTPWSGDFGDARFADPEPGFPFTLHDGVLRIEARKDADGKWASGLLSAVDPKDRGFTQKFGYFEARMKMPKSKGVWPAFWLIGIDKSKSSSEIDIVEHYGQFESEFNSVWHIWGKDGAADQGESHTTKVPEGSLSRDFHTYGVDVADDRTTFYFDRKKIWSIDTPDEFKMPFYPLVNLALGSGWPIDETISPSFLWVDYIHVYQRKPAA